MLGDFAFDEDEDPVDPAKTGHSVGSYYYCALATQCLNPTVGGALVFAIQAARRLIQEHQRRFRQEGSDYRHSLSLSL